MTAIAAGVGSIMPSYSSWNGESASGSKRLLTEILKGELGFEGFLISDYNAIDALPGDYRSRHQAVDQRRHGHGDGAAEVPRVLHHAQGPGRERARCPLARIDDAVLRILRVKFAMGLFDEGR